MKLCKCGIRDWHWTLDSQMRSWIKCRACGENMFDKGIGVILINWDFTTIDDWNLDDVFEANQKSNGIIGDLK